MEHLVLLVNIFLDFFNRLRNCNYCGKVFCSDCCYKLFYIPSYIIKDGNFDQQYVCNKCEIRLKQKFDQPIILLEKLSDNVKNNIGKKKNEGSYRFTTNFI